MKSVLTKSTGKSGFARQRGFSLVELMIAGVLGLILIAGVIQLFLGSNQNYTLQGQMSSIQEDGRFALMFLEDQIQQASWSDDFLVVPKPVQIATSLDGDSDSVTIAYKAAVNGLDNRDCNAAVVADGNIVNRFFVLDDDLMCLGNGSPVAQPLLANVEKFQVLYGVETDGGCPDGVVNSYMDRTAVVAANLQDFILSVRIALLLTSEENVLPQSKVASFQVLDQPFDSPSDRLARRLFQQTIFLPNAVYATVGNPQAVIDCMANM